MTVEQTKKKNKPRNKNCLGGAEAVCSQTHNHKTIALLSRSRQSYDLRRSRSSIGHCQIAANRPCNCRTEFHS